MTTTPPRQPDRLRVLLLDTGSPAMTALREHLAEDPEIEVVVVAVDPSTGVDTRALLQAALAGDRKR